MTEVERKKNNEEERDNTRLSYLIAAIIENPHLIQRLIAKTESYDGDMSPRLADAVKDLKKLTENLIESVELLTNEFAILYMNKGMEGILI